MEVTTSIEILKYDEWLQSLDWSQVSEILPLYMEGIWKPINSKKLYAFLTHTNCPIEPAIAHKLANSIILEGRAYGPAWNRAYEEVLSDIRNELKGSDDLENDFLIAQIEFGEWLPISYFKRSMGADIDWVERTANHVEEWLGELLKKPLSGKSIYYLSNAKIKASQLKKTLESIKNHRLKKIKPKDLKILLDRITASTSSHSVSDHFFDITH